MSNQNDSDSMIDMQEQILDCIRACKKYDYQSYESRLNFCVGYLDKEYNCISDLLNFVCTGIDVEIPF